MIRHQFALDMVPGGSKTEVWMNQYDEDFEWDIELLARSGEFVVQPGSTVAIRGTKPDGNGFSADGILEGTHVIIAGDKQITAAAGTASFELTLYKDGKELNTANFAVYIERAALDKDTMASRSQTRELVEIEDNAEELIAAAHRAEVARDQIADFAQEVAANKDAAQSAQSAAETAQTAAENAQREVEQKAALIAQLDGEAKSIAQQAYGLALSADNANAEMASDMRLLQGRLLQLEGKGEYYAEELEVTDAGLVYLLNNGQRIAGPYGPFAGNGGGGGSSATNHVEFSISNSTGWLSKTVTEEESCPVSVVWTSIMHTESGDIPTGAGTVKIMVNGTVKATLNAQQGQVPIELKPYLSSGTNVVRVNVADGYGNNSTIIFTVNKISLSISSTFDATVPYSNAITFAYTPIGEVTKTVHFIMDGREIGTNTTAVSNRTMTFSIPQQTHGAHTFECYFDCNINGQTVTSNRLYYEIICLESMNATPIIVSSFNETEVTQYTSLAVKYTVYDPTSLTANVRIMANGLQVSSATVDRTEQVFSYRCSKVGPLTIEISSGGVSKTIDLEVTASEVNAVAETDQLKLYLSSTGRSNNEAAPGRWSYEGISAQFQSFNFVSDGWLLDSDGVPILRLSGDARLTIPYKPFASDFRTSGKTIELEFATRDVIDYDAPVLSCYAGDRGLLITPQRATLRSEQSEIYTQYKEGEHIRISFVVEKRAANRLMLIYVNGIASGVIQYPSGDDFSQAAPVNITMGSNDCTLDLYCIRVYDKDLSRHQILDNMIADTQDSDKMISLWTRNQVFDAYGNVVIDQLPADLPYMIISCAELPQYKGDKKTVSVSYTDPLQPGSSFTAEGCQANVQGTSSAPYARKNYDMQFKQGFEMPTGHADNYALADNIVPFNRFVLKADVASSESVNNTGLTCLYNDATPYKTKEQTENPKVRQGIYGFPIVVFWHDTEHNTTSFLGKYNFNLPKRAPEPYGYSGNMESWEWQNNTSNLLLFKSDYFDETPYVDPESGEERPNWRKDFEARFPSDAWLDYTKIHELVSFIKSTDRLQITGDAITPVTYNGVTYDHDTAAYRLAIFRNGIGEIMEVDSAIFYYIFTELFLMVDSRAKNMFIGFKGGPVTLSGSTIDRKAVLEPYDMDTALGTNNEGSLVFGYNYEDIDHLPSGADIFNGQQSVLWCNLRDAFPTEIMQMYKNLRSAGTLSYTNVENMYEERQAKWPEAIWNEDAWFKYILPLTNPDPGKSATSTYLPMMQGSKAEQRKWWLYNRFRYMDSKWNAGDALQDTIILRAYSNGEITITPYADIYPTIGYSSHSVQARGERNVGTTLAVTLDNLNDTDVAVYSASQIKSLGDLSALRVGLIDISKATRLQDLKLGDNAAGYSNGNLTDLSLQNNTMLRMLDLRNCNAYAQAVDLSNCRSIQHAYFDGTKITGVTLPNGGVLQTLHVPDTIRSIEIRNQRNLTDLQIADYTKITSFVLENPSDAAETVFRAALNSMPAGARVRATGITMELDSAEAVAALYDRLDTYRGLDENGNNMDKAQLSGLIHIPSATDAELASFAQRYPYVTVDADYSSVHIYYYDYDNTLLHTETIISGGNGAYGGQPTRASTAQYAYSFAGWSQTSGAASADANACKNVTADRSVYAVYSATTRTYTVIWKNSDGTVLETDTKVPYGATPNYDGSTPSSSSGYSFVGWEPAISTVTGDAVYTAVHSRTYTVYFYNGTTLLQTVSNVRQGGTAAYTKATPTKNDVSNTEDYSFVGWSPAPSNIQADTSCYAQYDCPGITETISDSWAEILTAVRNGTYRTKYKVGDTKKIDLGSEGFVSMEIVAFNSDELSDDSGTAAITWLSKQLLPEKHVFGTSDSVWDNSDLRSYLRNTIISLIPTQVSSAIKTVKKYTYINSSNTDNLSYETVWAPSAREVGFESKETAGPVYLRTDNARKKDNVPSSDTSYKWWYTRSAYSSQGVETVNYDGTKYSGTKTSERYVAFGFCT